MTHCDPPPPLRPCFEHCCFEGRHFLLRDPSLVIRNFGESLLSDFSKSCFLLDDFDGIVKLSVYDKFFFFICFIESTWGTDTNIEKQI